MTQEHDWVREYSKKGALWIHSGDPSHPHALLTSGNHSNGFFNSRLVIADEELLGIAAKELALMLKTRHFRDFLEVQHVVGPQTGATKLAELVALEITSMLDGGDTCSWSSPAKMKTAEGRRFVFENSGSAPKQGERVLLCEDVLTTGASVKHASDAVVEAGGRLLSTILVLVNRSVERHELEHSRILSLVEHPMPIWTPEECPLCKQGSEAIRPKDDWARLTQP